MICTLGITIVLYFIKILSGCRNFQLSLICCSVFKNFKKEGFSAIDIVVTWLEIT